MTYFDVNDYMYCLIIGAILVVASGTVACGFNLTRGCLPQFYYDVLIENLETYSIFFFILT